MESDWSWSLNQWSRTGFGPKKSDSAHLCCLYIRSLDHTERRIEKSFERGLE